MDELFRASLVFKLLLEIIYNYMNFILTRKSQYVTTQDTSGSRTLTGQRVIKHATDPK